MKKETDVGAFFEYLEEMVYQVEAGRLPASKARARIIRDWGGQTIGYLPKRDPKQREQVRDLIDAGVPERKARRVVTGK